MQTDLACSFEMKSDSGETAGFSGIASTDDRDSFGDILEAGCFIPIPIRAGRPDVLLLRDHKREKVIGGFTRIEQEGRSLVVEGELLLDVADARETYSLLKRGFLSGLSVGFSIDPNGVKYEKDERRRIRKGKLREISIVGMPANEGARITAVKAEVGAWLLKNGCTEDEAALVLKSGIGAVLKRRSERDALAQELRILIDAMKHRSQ